MSLNFEKHAAKGNEVLKELAIELGDQEDKARAGRILRAVLHALRELVPIEEAFQFIAQLPMTLKALYVDGWHYSPTKNRRIKTIEEFTDEVFEQGGRSAAEDFPSVEATREAVMAVFRVLRRHVSEGEIEDIQGVMPKQLKELWDEPIWID